MVSTAFSSNLSLAARPILRTSTSTVCSRRDGPTPEPRRLTRKQSSPPSSTRFSSGSSSQHKSGTLSSAINPFDVFTWYNSLVAVPTLSDGALPPPPPPRGPSDRFSRPDRSEDGDRGAENELNSPYLPRMRLLSEQDVNPAPVLVQSVDTSERAVMDSVRGGLAAGVAVAWLVCGLSLLRTLSGKEEMDELLGVMGNAAVVGAALSGATAAVAW